MRALVALLLALALAACDGAPPALWRDDTLPDLVWIDPTPFQTPTRVPTPTYPQLQEGVYADRALIRMDRSGRLVYRLDGRDYRVRLEKRAGEWRAVLEPVADPPLPSPQIDVRRGPDDRPR